MGQRLSLTSKLKPIGVGAAKASLNRASPLFVNEWWLAFTAFVGANLLQSGLTKWCMLENILRKLGITPGC